MWPFFLNVRCTRILRYICVTYLGGGDILYVQIYKSVTIHFFIYLCYISILATLVFMFYKHVFLAVLCFTRMWDCCDSERRITLTLMTAEKRWETFCLHCLSSQTISYMLLNNISPHQKKTRGEAGVDLGFIDRKSNWYDSAFRPEFTGQGIKLCC